MVMAGGTGGHVFPALAVANELRTRGMDVFWLGATNGFETSVVPNHGFPLETIAVRGLRGNGLRRWLTAPLQLGLALFQVWGVVSRRRPGLVIGMGGFASGPGGIMAWLRGIPLVIHEQNAVPGLTNRWLAHLARRVLEAFPGSFSKSAEAQLTGNPVRDEIVNLVEPAERMNDRPGRARLLVLGGSQGAQILNETLPQALAALEPGVRPSVRHQAGRDKARDTEQAYRTAAVEAEVTEFMTDMAAAYAWADLVVCRSGALTVAELAAAGVGAILVPYAHAVDDHQTKNAFYLTEGGAALLLPQQEANAERLASLLEPLLADRGRCRMMAESARRLALPLATKNVADVCEELLA